MTLTLSRLLSVRLKIFFALCMLALNVSPAHAQTPPRLWEVSDPSAVGKGGHTYLLGVSHVGLDVEYDQYFLRKVVPAFHLSDALYLENADYNTRDFRPCQTPMTSTDEGKQTAAALYQTLLQFYVEMSKTSLAANGTNNDSMNDDAALLKNAKYDVDKHSEFGSVLFLRNLYLQLRPLPATSKPLGHGQVALFLLSAHPVPIHSVDTAGELLANYCDMPVSERIDAVNILLDAVRKPQKIIEDADVKKANSRFITLLQSQDETTADDDNDVWPFVPSNHLPLNKEQRKSANRHMLCDRTSNWIPKIIASMGHGNNFYALGLSHFMDDTADNPGCKGLLDDLRQRGYTVTLVQ